MDQAKLVVRWLENQTRANERQSTECYLFLNIPFPAHRGELYCGRNTRKPTRRNHYSYSHFTVLYRAWFKKQRISMRQTHRAGEKLFVDYAGLTLKIIDPLYGRRTTCASVCHGTGGQFPHLRRSHLDTTLTRLDRVTRSCL